MDRDCEGLDRESEAKDREKKEVRVCLVGVSRDDRVKNRVAISVEALNSAETKRVR